MKIPRIFALFIFLFSFVLQSTGQNSVADERQRAKAMLKVVSQDIEKNFYDPNMRGLNWKALTEEAKSKIEKADSIGQIYTAIFALVDKISDSHTQFLPPQRTSRPLFGFEAKAYGERILIYELKKDGAAKAAGLIVGDQILKVNGFDADRSSFDLMMLFFRILQPVGRMDLTIVRGNEPPRVVPVTAKFKTQPVVLDLTQGSNIWDLIREEENEEKRSKHGKWDEDGIGYLELTSFEYRPDWMLGFADKVAGAKAVIIDLRGNLGGSVDTLETFVGRFDADSDSIADMITRNKTEPMKVKHHNGAFKVPLVIMIDSESASAAEAFARHFQRIGKAKVIGDRSSGRLTAARFFVERMGVDTIVPYGIQVAIGRVVFAGGEELEKKGVVPDQACLPSADDLREKRDPCLELARTVLRDQLAKH